MTDYRELARHLNSLGVTRAYMKALSNNDNSKNQIYLGPSFEALQLLPFGEILQGSAGANPNLKASVNFFWLSESGRLERAIYAQLILYPQYPEVRLSGFLKGCVAAPSEYLRPIAREQRTDKDGRFLILGVTPDDRIIGYLAAPGRQVARSIEAEFEQLCGKKLFVDFPLGNQSAFSRKLMLIAKLTQIVHAGWHPSQRLDAEGRMLNYEAPNAGGYTLESLFGIIPNGISEPDYLGWELKAFGGNRITLMTPEPDAGYYGENGAAAFVRKYGHDAGNDTIYFTGIHRANSRNDLTGLTLSTIDYDVVHDKFTGINGGLALFTDSGEPVAIWTFKRLIAHWARKHALAAYVKYEKSEIQSRLNIRYLAPAHLGEGTDFSKFMAAFIQGTIYYDPAPKLSKASTPHSRVKARSQFRINSTSLGVLYHSFTDEQLQ